MGANRCSTAIVLLAPVAVMCFAGLLAATATAGELRVGASAVKITPPNGTPMAGYYGLRESQGVLDDLYAKAIVLDDGKTKAAMVVCDLIGMPRPPVIEARKRIAEKTGIPGDHVMISATHAHTGPVVIGDTAIEELVTGGSKLSQDYIVQLPKWIAQAVDEANARAVPAGVSYGSENEAGISFIRRFWMKDGTVGWNPGKLNPNILRPIGCIDPQVHVVYVQSLGEKPQGADGGKPIATYVNFANHLDTTGGMLISADFPGALARGLAAYKGPDMVTVFANGACGNINHLDVKSSTPQSGPEEAKRIGAVLAGAVLKAYLRLKPVEDSTLRVRREVVQLQPAPVTPEEIRQAREDVKAKDKKMSFLEQVKMYQILDVAARQGKLFEVDVQVISLGKDIAWVALPGEVFVELGRSIKTASPFQQTNVVELSNGGNHYIPHRSAYAEGQYEAVSTRYAAGAGELLVSAAIRLLGDLHREAADNAAGKPAAK